MFFCGYFTTWLQVLLECEFFFKIPTLMCWLSSNPEDKQKVEVVGPEIWLLMGVLSNQDQLLWTP